MAVQGQARSGREARDARAGAPAFVFPGQGSQTEDMHGVVRRTCPHLLHLATEWVGADPFYHYDEGTRFLQPAMYCATIAAWIEMGAPEAACFAGHSMGEISALAAAGSITVDEGLKLVVVRGRAMQHAAEAAGDDGGMLAVALGLEAAEEVAERFGLAVANDNAPRQVVLSGPRAALLEAKEDVRSSGVAAKLLPVQGALHSRAMEPAVGPFRRAVGQVRFLPPRVPVYSCVTARPFQDIPRELVACVTGRVRWREVTLHIDECGTSEFVEVGPGSVLTGLIKRTLRGAHDR